ncbi:Malonyl-CoA decarboxylase, mitochondrial [Coccomyxa sp. Obi]|nr:Malonyl-CoA decarboxylase, mitochondrial [Coccomyxa sp. Obi]
MALARAVCGFGLALAKPLPSLLHAHEKLGETFVVRLYNAGRSEDDDSVTTFWQRYLSSPGTSSQFVGSSQLRDEDIRQLLSTAIRVRQGRTSSILPQQIFSIFMTVYESAMRTNKEKRQLFDIICKDFGVQEGDLHDAIKLWQTVTVGQRQGDAVFKAAERVRQASLPLYTMLFVPISNQPKGLKFLVDLRADVLEAAKDAPADSGHLRALSESLRHVLAEWFSIGLLELHRITWQTSSGGLLEKVMKYEAVHPFTGGWQDLKTRMASNRRVFGYFHSSLPDEPLVLLHTALMDTVPSTIDQILQGQTMEVNQTRVAAFYSISSTQKGLSGIDLGNYLIKEVAHRLLQEHPRLDTLVTLSPAPGFRGWLTAQLKRRLHTDEASNGPEELLQPMEVEKLTAHAEDFQTSHPPSVDRSRVALATLEQILVAETWMDSTEAEEVVQPIVMRLAARYFLHERRRRLALDPVANFHLRNGASVWRLNWRADLSERGRAGSFGIMVNYMYALEDVPGNSEAYLVDSKVVSSPAVADLVPGHV